MILLVKSLDLCMYPSSSDSDTSSYEEVLYPNVDHAGEPTSFSTQLGHRSSDDGQHIRFSVDDSIAEDPQVDKFLAGLDREDKVEENLTKRCLIETAGLIPSQTSISSISMPLFEKTCISWIQSVSMLC